MLSSVFPPCARPPEFRGPVILQAVAVVLLSMSRRILIVDDDEGFNRLLTDVFRQSNYEVLSAYSAIEGLRLFRDFPVDLVVTDHRMPQVSGADFVRQLVQSGRRVPIIMVSGHLDNEMIRFLIKQGIGGIFTKPLNIFALLRKAAELIDRHQSGHAVTPGHFASLGVAPTAETFRSQLPFVFTSYAGKSPVAVEFAKRLYAARHFRTNLVLLGEEGVDFVGVVHDLCAFEESPVDRPLFLLPDQISPDLLLREMERMASLAERMTLVVLRTELLGLKGCSVVRSAWNREGVFAGREFVARWVFCTSRTIDELYDAEMIDDALYMQIGTAEIAVPALREVAEDIPILAARVLGSFAAAPPQLSKEAVAFLQSHPWSGNFSELHRALERLHAARVEGTVSEAQLVAACEGLAIPRVGAGRPGQGGLSQSLEAVRNEVVQAASLLCGRDPVLVARALGLPLALVQRVLDGTVSREAGKEESGGG